MSFWIGVFLGTILGMLVVLALWLVCYALMLGRATGWRWTRQGFKR
jgi:hypothetical protein